MIKSNFTNLKFKKNQIIAHRGFSKIQTENTLEAIKEAYYSNISFIEVDIQMTLDKKLVVFHDFDLKRLASINQKISLNTLEDLNKIKLFNKKTKEYNLSILSFEKLLEIAKQFSLSLNIELKTESTNEKDLQTFANLVIQALEKVNEVPILISSFSYKLLEEFYFLSRKYPLGFLVESFIPKDLEKKLQKINAYSVHLEDIIASKEIVNLMHSLGYYVLVYTVDDVNKARELFEMGVDAIFSNDCKLGL